MKIWLFKRKYVLGYAIALLQFMMHNALLTVWHVNNGHNLRKLK